MQESSDRWWDVGDLVQAGAIVPAQHHQHDRGAGCEQLLAGEGQARAPGEQFEEGEEQQGEHGAEDQAQDAALFMHVHGAHGERAFEQGETLLGSVTPFGLGQYLGGGEVGGIG